MSLRAYIEKNRRLMYLKVLQAHAFICHADNHGLFRFRYASPPLPPNEQLPHFIHYISGDCSDGMEEICPHRSLDFRL